MDLPSEVIIGSASGRSVMTPIEGDMPPLALAFGGIGFTTDPQLSRTEGGEQTMTTRINVRTTIRNAILLLTMGALVGPPVSAFEQDDQVRITTANAEAIREQLDEAEDLIESLLDWRHVLTAVTTSRGDSQSPMAPANTLISVSREELQRLSVYLTAMSAMAPKAAQTAAPRGDLRAHVDKAHEIARELLPIAAPARPVGTAGTDDRVVTIDRTAIERLEIELDAIERLLPRLVR